MSRNTNAFGEFASELIQRHPPFVGYANLVWSVRIRAKVKFILVVNRERCHQLKL